MNAAPNRVLVVDDEAGLRRSLNVTLGQRGFVVDEAEEGLPALRLIESAFEHGTPYGAIVADIHLPDINGLKLLEIIKSKYPRLPVVVISAYGSEVTQDTVLSKRGDGFLNKPFLVDELTNVLSGIPSATTGPVAQPEEDTALEKHSVSAYSLVTVDPAADFWEVYRTLYFMDNVIYCDAVQGGCDIVMLLNAPSAAEVEEIWRTRVKGLPGVAVATFERIARPKLDKPIAQFIKEVDQQRTLSPESQKLAVGPNSISTYLLVEVDKGRLNDVYAKLYFMDGVVSCDAVHGAYDIVVLVQSNSFKENDRIFNENIKLIDGITRTATLKVIHILEA